MLTPDRLIFVVSAPRTGSTLLSQVLNGTSQIHAPPEPHLIPPLAHLGFYGNVDKAPYDPLQSAKALRHVIQQLPHQEADYLAALRAYTDTLYERLLPPNKGYFLDKTPANALCLPFLGKLYPNARYIVLSRHPAALFASYAESFFGGDYEAAVAFNPILVRYIPAIAAFLRQSDIPFLHVHYEDFVATPEQSLSRICAYLNVPFEPTALNYQPPPPGLGDPVGLKQYRRPHAHSIDRWGAELAAHRLRYEVVARQIAQVDPSDLEILGYPLRHFWKPMEEADPAGWTPRKIDLDRFQAQRRGLRWLKKLAHPGSGLHQGLSSARFYMDVLIRDTFADYRHAPKTHPKKPISEE